METDKPNGNDLLNNGKLNTTQKKKAGRFDENRQINNDSDDDKESDIDKVKERNRDLKFMVGKLQKQLNDLIEQVNKLNDIILKEKSEKDKFDLLQKKSETKSPSKQAKKRKKFNISNKKVTQNEQTSTKPVLSTLDVKEDQNVKAKERDGNEAQPNNTQAINAHTADNVNNDINMSENGVNENDKRLREDDSSDNDNSMSQSSSEDDEEDDDEDDKDNSDANAYAKSNNKATTSTKRSQKLPPIDIWTDKRADVQREIQGIVPDNSCLYSKVNNEKFRVLPNDAATRTIVIEYLKSKKYEYNTYTK